METKRTYVPYWDWKEKSKQTEYTEATPLLNKDGTLNAKGWARHNVFDYDRTLVKKGSPMSKKEWDFYQIADGKFMLQLSFANIGIGGYVAAKLIDLEGCEVIADATQIYLGGKKHLPPPKGDVPNRYKDKIGKAEFDFDTKVTYRTLKFKMPLKGKMVECDFTMDIAPDLENITTVLPFEGDNTKYFMTTKQNCMPCEGTFKWGDDYCYTFKKEDSFCALDWGRVNTPHKMVWYWGNGSTYITDDKGEKHLFGFEITWAIGDESNATETAIFYDGKAHKFGAVDVETFPKPDKFMDDWKFVSEDGRFNLTMKPFFDHHSDMNVGVARMHTHQVHGLWSGDVTLDDGTKLQINDMYAFCEYVENKW